MPKRSPRYPRHSLAKAIDITRKLYAGAYQSKVDVDSAARVIGYAGSSGGAAASAIGALRQYGLVDGLRGDLAVSDLAMRILQPMNDLERVEALYEASRKPEIFDRITAQFGGRLPSADDPIRSFLIRTEGFSPGGADELIGVLRDTLAGLPDNPLPMALPDGDDERATSLETLASAPPPQPAASQPTSTLEGELITLPLGQNCKAELRLIGEVTPASYLRLIKHLELLGQIAAEDGG